MQKLFGPLLFWMIWAGACAAQAWSFSQDATQNIGSVDLIDQDGLQATFRCHTGAPGTSASFVAQGTHSGMVTLLVHPRHVPSSGAEVTLAVDGVPYLKRRFETATPENVPAVRLRMDSGLFAALETGDRFSLTHQGAQSDLPLLAPDSFAALRTYCARAPSFATRAKPGFKCAKATTSTEHAICADIDLTLLDVDLNAAMLEAIARLGEARARGGQRAWLPMRDSCGASKACIAQTVRTRIDALRGQKMVVNQVPVSNRPPQQAAPPKVQRASPVQQVKPAVPVQQAQTAAVTGMPAPARISDYSRNMKIARDAWEKIPGYNATARPDQHGIKDFSATMLTDGSWVIPGLGVRLREVTERSGKRSLQMLKIIDIQEFGPVWAARNENIKVDGYFGGGLFSLDSNLRTALGRSGTKKLQQGFSVPVSVAIPYTNHKNEAMFQILGLRLRVAPPTRERGRWLVAEPDAAPTDLQGEIDAIVAEAQTRITADPCGLSNRAMMAIEQEIDLLRWKADAMAIPNLRLERDTACKIAQEGTYDAVDLQRLAVLRTATCADLEGGTLSPEVLARSDDLSRRVPKSQYLDFAEIGVFDLESPDRRKLTAEKGARRMACITQYLEDALFN